MPLLQVVGVDPGITNIMTGSEETCFTGVPAMRSNTLAVSSSWYRQEAGITTSNAKTAQWQQKNTSYKDIVTDLSYLSLKTTSLERFKVGTPAFVE